MTRMRSRWVSFQLTPLFGINLTGFESDRAGILAEIEAVEAVLCKQPRGSVLAVLDIAFTDMIPEVAAFIHSHSGQPEDPIRKLAIIGVSDAKKFWYRVTRRVTWPKNARFFDEHEKAKVWLIKESF